MEDIKKKGELRNEQLEQASGGFLEFGSTEKVDVFRRDAKGNATHFVMRNDPFKQSWYYVCPHCGGLLHKGFFGRMYCDPCDESWFPGILATKNCQRVGIYPGC